MLVLVVQIVVNEQLVDQFPGRFVDLVHLRAVKLD